MYVCTYLPYLNLLLLSHAIEILPAADTRVGGTCNAVVCAISICNMCCHAIHYTERAITVTVMVAVVIAIFTRFAASWKGVTSAPATFQIIIIALISGDSRKAAKNSRECWLAWQHTGKEGRGVPCWRRWENLACVCGGVGMRWRKYFKMWNLIFQRSSVNAEISSEIAIWNITFYLAKVFAGGSGKVCKIKQRKVERKMANIKLIKLLLNAIVYEKKFHSATAT